MEAPKAEGRIIFCSLRGPLESLRDVCIGDASQMVSKRPGLTNHLRNNKGKVRARMRTVTSRSHCYTHQPFNEIISIGGVQFFPLHLPFSNR